MVYKWAKISLVYFLIVALMGCLLRYQQILPINGLNFKNFLHSHSHVAFLGWIFNALFAALIYSFIPEKESKFRTMFVVLQVSVLGMMISFPIQGYAAVSILFSTLHIFLSYWFAVKFLKEGLKNKLNNKDVSWRFIQWALIFMIISSIGPFALGGIMANGLSGSIYYNLAIYFYLHFQYNGWFTFAVLGLFFGLLNKSEISYNYKYSSVFFWLMTLSCLPSYALSAFWVQPPLLVYITGFISAVLQIIALIYFLVLLYKIRNQLKIKLQPFIYNLFRFSLLAFVLKNIMQFSSAIPAVADLAYKLRNFTLGYLHLVFIGFVSIFLIAFFVQEQFFTIRKKAFKKGIILLIAGFIGSEALVFLQPLYILGGWGILPFGGEMLFFVSLLMPIGLGLMVYNISLRKDRNEDEGVKSFRKLINV